MHTRVIGAFVFCGPKRQISFWKIFFWKKEKVKRSNGNNLRKNWYVVVILKNDNINRF